MPRMEERSGVALYIHIPFCRAKCAYCDFTSYAGLDALHDKYITALVQEMEPAESFSIRTVYIGGGTPTVLTPAQFAQIFGGIERRFDTGATSEITVEANPGTVTRETLAGLRALGVNRLSLGVQSLVEGELRLLGRIHSAPEALQAFRAARRAGFDNLSLDLIYGLPGQSLASWRASLEGTLALQPDHLSLYALTVEESTPLAASIARGQLPSPDPDLAADMYELAQDLLSAAGFVHYEISNWAASPARVCRHNLTYWRNEPYLGLGAGAHSWLGQRRRSNLPAPQAYLEQARAGELPIADDEAIDLETEMGETMMLGLRLLHEGVDRRRFQARFGLDMGMHYAAELQELAQLGLIDLGGERVTLSPRGRLLGNQVFLRFVGG